MRGDGLYKRPGSPYWYYKVKLNSRWREVSTKAKSYQKAKQVRSEAMKLAEEGSLVIGGLSRLPVQIVAAKYLEATKLRIAGSTLKKERLFLARPMRLFGNLKCEHITAAHILSLQQAMNRENCSSAYVNLVVDAFARILRFAKVWARIKDDVRRLPEHAPPIGRVLSPAEKDSLFATAASNPNWLAAYCAALVAVNTTLRACELRSLIWSDVDFLDRTVSVRGSKTDAGLRRTPLNDGAMLGFRMLRERCINLGTAVAGGSYVFPACEHGIIDSRQSQRSWRSAWRALTKTAGFSGLRFHDMRHQCITELAEGGNADQTIMAIAGHMSRRMLEHYSHVRHQAKRVALDSLSPIIGVGSSLTPLPKVN